MLKDGLKQSVEHVINLLIVLVKHAVRTCFTFSNVLLSVMFLLLDELSEVAHRHVVA